MSELDLDISVYSEKDEVMSLDDQSDLEEVSSEELQDESSDENSQHLQSIDSHDEWCHPNEVMVHIEKDESVQSTDHRSILEDVSDEELDSAPEEHLPGTLERSASVQSTDQWSHLEDVSDNDDDEHKLESTNMTSQQHEDPKSLTMGIPDRESQEKYDTSTSKDVCSSERSQSIIKSFQDSLLLEDVSSNEESLKEGDISADEPSSVRYADAEDNEDSNLDPPNIDSIHSNPLSLQTDSDCPPILESDYSNLNTPTFEIIDPATPPLMLNMECLQQDDMSTTQVISNTEESTAASEGCSIAQVLLNNKEQSNSLKPQSNTHHTDSGSNDCGQDSSHPEIEESSLTSSEMLADDQIQRIIECSLEVNEEKTEESISLEVHEEKTGEDVSLKVHVEKTEEGVGGNDRMYGQEIENAETGESTPAIVQEDHGLGLVIGSVEGVSQEEFDNQMDHSTGAQNQDVGKESVEENITQRTTRSRTKKTAKTDENLNNSENHGNTSEQLSADLFSNIKIKEEPNDDDFIKEYMHYDGSSNLTFNGLVEDDFDVNSSILDQDESLDPARLILYQDMFDICNNGEYRCKFCCSKLQTFENLSKHIDKFHHQNYKCKYCSTQFSMSQSLAAHVRGCHQENVNRNKHGYTSRRNAAKDSEDDEDNPKPKRRFHCKYCRKNFLKKSALKSHIRNKHAADVPKQLMSDEVVAKDSNKCEEKSSDTTDGKYMCRICGRKFAVQQGLASHSRPCRKLHNIDEPTRAEKRTYVKNVKIRKNLKELDASSELIIRNEVKSENNSRNPPLNVEIKEEKNLTQVIGKRMISGGLKCNDCNFECQTLKSLREHLNNTHPKRWCRYCPKTFHSERRLCQHLFRHIGDLHLKEDNTYDCEACHTVIAANLKGVRHLKNHILGKSPTGVDYCLEKQIMKECSLCGQPFATLSCLVQHEQEHVQKELARKKRKEEKTRKRSVKRILEEYDRKELKSKLKNEKIFNFVPKSAKSHRLYPIEKCKIPSKETCSATRVNMRVDNELINVSDIPFKCGMCRARFPNSQFLLHHMTLHMNGQYVFNIEVDKKNENNKSPDCTVETTSSPAMKSDDEMSCSEDDTNSDAATTKDSTLSTNQNRGIIDPAYLDHSYASSPYIVDDEAPVLKRKLENQKDEKKGTSKNILQSNEVSNQPSFSQLPESFCSSKMLTENSSEMFVPTETAKPSLSTPVSLSTEPLIPQPAKPFLMLKVLPAENTSASDETKVALRSLLTSRDVTSSEGTKSQVKLPSPLTTDTNQNNPHKLQQLIPISGKGPFPNVKVIKVDKLHPGRVLSQSLNRQQVICAGAQVKSKTTGDVTSSNFIELTRFLLPTEQKIPPLQQYVALRNQDAVRNQDTVTVGNQDKLSLSLSSKVNVEEDSTTISADPSDLESSSDSEVYNESSDENDWAKYGQFGSMTHPKHAKGTDQQVPATLGQNTDKKKKIKVVEVSSKSGGKKIKSQSKLSKKGIKALGKRKCIKADSYDNPKGSMRIKNFRKSIDFTHGTWFECELCMHVSLNLKDYNLHVAQHKKTKTKLVKCSHCSRRFLSKWHLAKHLESHRGNSYMCHSCNRGFKSAALALKHMPSCEASNAQMPKIKQEKDLWELEGLNQSTPKDESLICKSEHGDDSHTQTTSSNSELEDIKSQCNSISNEEK